MVGRTSLQYVQGYIDYLHTQASGGKRSVAVEQTNGHLGKRSRAGFVNAMTHGSASLPLRVGGSGSYSPPETPTPGDTCCFMMQPQHPGPFVAPGLQHSLLSDSPCTCVCQLLC